MRLKVEDKVKVIAKKKRITLEQIAGEIGCSRQNLWNRLRADSYTPPEIEKIAAAIGCRAEVVFTDIETGETL